MTPQALLLGFGLLLLMMGGGVFALLAQNAATKKREARFAAVLGPHLAARAPAAPRRGMAERVAASPLLARGARLLGIDMDQIANYPVRWWIVLVAAVPVARGATGLASTLLGDGMVMATPAAWLFCCRAAFHHFAAARRDTLLRQFPDALGMITRAIAVGVPVTEAIRIVAREAPEPTAGEFRRIADRLAIGTPLDRALAETALRTGVPEYRFFATALSLQAQTGGGLREALETLADVIRKRVGLRERGYALASEARTSAAILAALPFFAVGMLALISPGYVNMLFFDEDGQKILTLAIFKLLVGMWVMRNMIKRALS